MYTREIAQIITRRLEKKEIVILYGARQVGKTTLLKNLLNEIPDSVLIACDRPASEEVLESLNPARVKLFFGKNKVVALDEAQDIQNIGKLLN